MSNLPAASAPDSSGIPGLDTILAGGFTPHRLYLIEGVPGSGKTTLALQFLLEGLAKNETVLYVTLSETENELREVAASHGWSLDGVHIHELSTPQESLDPDSQYTMFHPSEVELGDTTKRILEQVEGLRPQRVVFDSLAELRLLAGSALRYRRQVLALKQYFVGRGCTVLLLDDSAVSEHGLHVHTIVHGVVSLDQLNPEYGGDRRRLRITKFRGRRFSEGYHDYEILTGGLRVFPRLVAAEYRRPGVQERISSGLKPLDSLLGGGLDRGTSTLLVGAAGTGKSSLATHFMMAAAERGERSAMFTFDESVRSLVTRSTGLGFDIHRHMDSGLISLQSIDPAELSPGEFSHRIRDAVEVDGARVIVIDSLNGYLNAMPEERFMIVQLHELLAFLGQLGVVTLLVSAQQGLIGQMANNIDVSYLADGVILLRYFEARGEVRQAISVLKKRTGAHERTIRELTIGSNGLSIGEPLRELRGVLTGVPQERGDPADTLRK
ncbi:ATPase domain-containing protein [Lysobacter koreensis]|uniref:non-specific serine/threonine protein kinase n=1 Tax=Lysobacter koreensis TaxID=266122 RepID=A0ABW2YLQ4_9GAMM